MNLVVDDDTQIMNLFTKETFVLKFTSKWSMTKSNQDCNHKRHSIAN